MNRFVKVQLIPLSSCVCVYPDTGCIRVCIHSESCMCRYVYIPTVCISQNECEGKYVIDGCGICMSMYLVFDD